MSHNVVVFRLCNLLRTNTVGRVIRSHTATTISWTDTRSQSTLTLYKNTFHSEKQRCFITIPEPFTACCPLLPPRCSYLLLRPTGQSIAFKAASADSRLSSMNLANFKTKKKMPAPALKSSYSPLAHCISAPLHWAPPPQSDITLFEDGGRYDPWRTSTVNVVLAGPLHIAFHIHGCRGVDEWSWLHGIGFTLRLRKCLL